MKESFDEWNDKKKFINSLGENKFFHSREIWWCSIGLNVGFEQNGKDKDFQRPVLILKGLSRQTCIVVPITSSQQEHIYRPSIGSITGTESKVILSQIRVIDTKRLIRRITILDQETFRVIRKSAKDML